MEREKDCYGIKGLGWEECRSDGQRARIGDELACEACFNELEFQVEKYKDQAFHDSLTKLPNRRALEVAFDELAEQQTEFGALSIDIKKFKRINDKNGHSEGDRFLQLTADFLRKQVRTKETNEPDIVAIISRSGGDEFFILAPLTPREDYNFSAQERLQLFGLRLIDEYQSMDEVKAYNEGLSEDQSLGLRIGLAVWKSSMELDDLMREADPKGQTPNLIDDTQRPS